jgi:arylsulfatase A-like enzyme
MSDYLGCCAAVDDGLGRILDCLEHRGLRDSTLVVYTSDHGCHFRTRNGEYKRSCHDASLRVPLVLSGPGVPRGQRIGNLVSLIDLPPTLLAAAGVPAAPGMRGRPLSALWGGQRSGPGLDAAPWREEIFAQISESEVARTIRTRRFKYAVRAPGKDGTRDSCSDLYEESFLYDLDADPHERANLVAEAGLEEVRGILRERLLARMAEAGESEPEIVPAGRRGGGT